MPTLTTVPNDSKVMDIGHIESKNRRFQSNKQNILVSVFVIVVAVIRLIVISFFPTQIVIIDPVPRNIMIFGL